MKGWQDVPLPAGLNERPKDARGYPITFVTLIQADGTPDFTTIDAGKIVECIQRAVCGMCGQGWPGPYFDEQDHLRAFIGGPLSIENRNFLDPPMHVPCAEYAMQVCPHIATPTARYAKPKLGGPEQRELFQGVADDRPEKFGLYITDKCDIAIWRGQPVFLPAPPIEVRWQEEA